MARNYIELMSAMLHREGGLHILSRTEVAAILSRGLSQATINIVNSLLGINNHSTLPFGTDDVSQLTEPSRSHRAYELSEVISKYFQLPFPNCGGTFAIQSTSHHHWDTVPWTHSLNDENWVNVAPGHFVDQSMFVSH